MLYASKLQNLVTLSTTEAEYVALSEGLRETIPVMDLLEEIARMELFLTYVELWYGAKLSKIMRELWNWPWYLR